MQDRGGQRCNGGETQLYHKIITSLESLEGAKLVKMKSEGPQDEEKDGATKEGEETRRDIAD